MRKKIPAVVFLIVLLCLLSGCSGGKKDTVQTVKIGVTLYDQYDTFISEMMAGLQPVPRLWRKKPERPSIWRS